jgi:hypothetical protein
MGSRVIYGEDERLLPWAAERIGIRSFRADARAIGFEQDGVLRAAVVFDTFSSTDCHMHVASDGSRRWLTRGFLAAAFAYPFTQMKLNRVTSPIAQSNRQALKFNLHLGFRPEGVHPQAASDGAMITTGLLREHCRFIPHGTTP